jgi:putative nucleotidyltransferase with HDIG domain
LFLFDKEMDPLEQVSAFLTARGVRAYWVGGLVRDVLLERRVVRDIDLAVEGDAKAMARAFADSTGGAFYLMDVEHNVARVIRDEVYFDLAELRGDLRSDLATRDFTVNAMALPISALFSLGRPVDLAKIVDPFGGIQDVRDRKIRALSGEVFQADPVRLLRAVRLAGELGFTVEPETVALVQTHAWRLADASSERARDELCKILALSEVIVWLRRLDQFGLLAALLPEVTALRGTRQPEPHRHDALEHTLQVVADLETTQKSGYQTVAAGRFASELVSHFSKRVSGGRSRGLLLRLIGLLHDIGKSVTGSVDSEGDIHFLGHETRGAGMTAEILERLRFSRDEIRIATSVVAHHLRPAQLAREPQVTNRSVYRFYRDVGAAGLDVCVLALSDARGKTTPLLDEQREAEVRRAVTILLERYFDAYDRVVAPRPLVSGRTLMQELRVPPGPQVGRLLEAIRQAQAEGQIQTREQALALARKEWSRWEQPQFPQPSERNDGT